MELKRLHIRNHLGRIFVGEAVAMYVATLLIYSNYMQYVLTPDNEQQSYFSFTFSAGMSIALGGYLSAFVSPLAPINPNVLIGMVVGGFLPARRIPIYLLSEFVGAMAAQFTVFGLFYDSLRDHAIRRYNGSMFLVPQTVLQCALPPEHTTLPTQVASVFLQVSILTCGTNCLMDRCNFNNPVQALPVQFGILICVLLNGFTHNAGGTMNSMMDLTGRIVSSCVGWGSAVWTHGNWFSWIPIVIGSVGAAFGAFAYTILIHYNLPSKVKEKEKDSKIGDVDVTKF